ncbi:MAG: hypothetical protein QXX41_09030 [Nitrososphaerota archaeon]
MMRTVEILITILIIMGAFVISSFYAVLPIPRRVSPMNLRRLALTTLQLLDSNYNLSAIVFKAQEDPDWVKLQATLSVLLPPNIVYNLTVYDVQTTEEGSIYVPYKSLSNAESLGIQSETTSCLVVSSNVTFKVIPEKIGEKGAGVTLYILNCSDANGWWITGYTAHSLAEDLYRLLSPYFQKTVMVQNTMQLARILNNQSLQGETVQNAVVINTFGEAVPIPSTYCVAPYNTDNYAYYCYFLGQRVRIYNWTWVSIVGYPFYYVSNTQALSSYQNTYGVHGVLRVGRSSDWDGGQSGINAFLQGLDNRPQYTYDKTRLIPSSGVVVTLSSQVLESCNYYGIYPSPNQTSSRALKSSILSDYNLKIALLVFNNFTEGGATYNPGALYQHIFKNDNKTTGSLLALGLTRTPDIRLTAISVLSYYKPRLYKSEFNATGTSRLAVLQLGIVGGV